MKNFFTSYITDAGENAYKLTLLGIFTVIAVILVLITIALVIRRRENNSQKLSAKQLAFSSIALALALVTSMIKLPEFHSGGSVTLFSMLFIALIGHWYGPYVGIMSAVSYGLLHFIITPIFYTPAQMLIDYPLAFGSLGLSGFFYKGKNGLIKGYILGVLGRYFFAFLSGLIFFAAYAEGSGMSVPIYSLYYNGSYIIPEAIATCILIRFPAMANALNRVKGMALE